MGLFRSKSEAYATQILLPTSSAALSPAISPASSSVTNACLDRSFPDFTVLRAALLDNPLEPSLNLSDYDHVAGDCDLIKRVIEVASREGRAQQPRVNRLRPPAQS
jgi:hypothetical protein